MNSSIWKLSMRFTHIAIGFSGYVIVFLGALLVTVTRSLGQGLPILEEKKSESVVMKPQHEKFQVSHDLRYHYKAQNRRDPFLPLVIPQSRERRSPSIEKLRTSECSWKLLGIISGMHGVFASIQNSNGKRYIVTSGSSIPSEGVMVKRIRKTEVELDYLDKKNVTTKLARPSKRIVSFNDRSAEVTPIRETLR